MAGPKPEITRETAIRNIQAVAARLGVTSLTLRQYREEGSFSATVIIERFGWSKVIRAAGLQPFNPKGPRLSRRKNYGSIATYRED
jgi:hypothetical protein